MRRNLPWVCDHARRGSLPIFLSRTQQQHHSPLSCPQLNLPTTYQCGVPTYLMGRNMYHKAEPSASQHGSRAASNPTRTTHEPRACASAKGDFHVLLSAASSVSPISP